MKKQFRHAPPPPWEDDFCQVCEKDYPCDLAGTYEILEVEQTGEFNYRRVVEPAIALGEG
jgi:hypothetical protein